jgi:thymidylate kinase
MEFHKRVYEWYKALAKAYPERIVCVDGSKTSAEIFEEILGVLKTHECI